MNDDPAPNHSLTALTSIATTMQGWSEVCARMAKSEPTLELQWYLKGRAEAHAMDADRARYLAHPLATVRPMQGDPVIEAYRASLKLVVGFASSNGEEAKGD